jgi:hypothetical protein
MRSGGSGEGCSACRAARGGHYGGAAAQEGHKGPMTFPSPVVAVRPRSHHAPQDCGALNEKKKRPQTSPGNTETIHRRRARAEVAPTIDSCYAYRSHEDSSWRSRLAIVPCESSIASLCFCSVLFAQRRRPLCLIASRAATKKAQGPPPWCGQGPPAPSVDVSKGRSGEKRPCTVYS